MLVLLCLPLLFVRRALAGAVFDNQDNTDYGWNYECCPDYGQHSLPNCFRYPRFVKRQGCWDGEEHEFPYPCSCNPVSELPQKADVPDAAVWECEDTPDSDGSSVCESDEAESSESLDDK